MIRGGRNYVSSSPAFSNDAKRLLVCAGNSVAVFSTATGLQVSSLDAHTAPVTAVIVVPASTPGSKILCFCWTTSLDGTIRYWDFAAPELIRTLDIKLPVYSMVIPSMVSQSAVSNEKTAKVFAYISVEAKTKSDNGLCGQVRKFNLTDSCMVGGAILAEMKKPEVLTISPSGDLFGVRRKRKLQIWKVPSADSDRTVLKKITLHHTKTISAIAFHPTQRIVAAGDVSGRILTWRGFGDKTFAMSAGHVNGSAMDTDEENPGVRVSDDADTCTTWHWHPGQVNLLSFSSDGAYLLSGGKEGVLVVWQVDTGKKKFLPRIGSPLLHLVDSPDPSLSSVQVYERNHQPVDEVTVRYFLLMTEVAACSLHVQCYRKISRDRLWLQIIVTSVVLSPDGSMMCTSEVRLPEDGLGNLICLKFWDSKSETGDFSLSTIVYEPHRDAKISDIAFNPKHRMAVSSSFGGDFKVWSSNSGVPEKEQIQPNSGWVCHSAGSYKKKSMTAAAFSPDGSVLAVAAETVITLWDPAKNLLVAVIGEVPMPIASLSFIGNSDHLVSTSLSSKPQLSVWSLSSLSICWSYGLHIEAIASSSDASSFAALVLLPQSVRADDSKDKANNSVGGLILLFNSAEPKPLAVWSVKKAKCGTLAFIKNKNQSCEQEQQEAQTLLAYMNGDHEYLLFNPYLKEGSEVSIAQWKGHQNSLEEAGKSRINLISDGVRFAGNLTSCFRSGKLGYESLYGELPPESKPAGKQIAWIPSAPTDERAWEKIFSSSSHNLPPLTKLCASFLESLLEKRSSVQE
ncbi:WD repeat-containing protein 75 [Linum grandiflorum]